eukprot:TRINITY_DN6020_c0_g1_i2.p1 TRINITY_DN6020_c0_g1~~TRINITY_DN6020_c0_g1_i2.p1  ORF type:complete len:303 (+),score=91.56 TRINITY_DN6020_c0_g1_i2:73-981(+)
MPQDADMKLNSALSSSRHDASSSSSSSTTNNREREICRDHQRGSCPRGDKCPFIHKRRAPRRDASSSGGGGGGRGVRQTGGPVLSLPRDVCRDFTQRNDCPRGETCPYLHPLPLTHLRVDDSRPPVICRDYLIRECPRQPCPYLHTQDVVSVCRNALRGACSRSDDDCPFHHLKTHPRMTEEPCRDFQRDGICPRGSSCPFGHVPEYVKICPGYRDGSCQNDLCPFHHGLSWRELHSSSPPSSSSSSSDPTLRKRRRIEEEEGDRIDILVEENELLTEEVKILRQENRKLRQALRDADIDFN